MIPGLADTLSRVHRRRIMHLSLRELFGTVAKEVRNASPGGISCVANSVSGPISCRCRNTHTKPRWMYFPCVISAVEGHFNHPHGREWTHLTDHVTPLLAEIVGASSGIANSFITHSDVHPPHIHNMTFPRCKGEGSRMYGHVDRKFTPHDDHVLQTNCGAV